MSPQQTATSVGVDVDRLEPARPDPWAWLRPGASIAGNATAPAVASKTSRQRRVIAAAVYRSVLFSRTVARMTGLAFFRSLVRVHWADTDAAGVVWHGNFFRWFESAEEELYRALGRPRQALLEELGIMMPRVDVRARFASPARPDELLTIGIALSELSERRIGFTFEVREHGSGRFLAEGSYRLAVVERATFTSVPVPPALAELLRRVPDMAAAPHELRQL